MEKQLTKLWAYFCSCCEGWFFVPIEAGHDPKRCPFCGSTDEFDLIENEIVTVHKEEKRK